MSKSTISLYQLFEIIPDVRFPHSQILGGSMEQYQNLNAAYQLLLARRVQLAKQPVAWEKLNHACSYIEKQIREIIAE